MYHLFLQVMQGWVTLRCTSTLISLKSTSVDTVEGDLSLNSTLRASFQREAVLLCRVMIAEVLFNNCGMKYTVIIYTADKLLGFTIPAHLSPRCWCGGSSKKGTSMSMGLQCLGT